MGMELSEQAERGMTLRKYSYDCAIPHDLLKALAGDPLLLAASDEQRLRRRILACLMAFSNWPTEDIEKLWHVGEIPKARARESGPQWIPCSERLPAENVLVAVLHEDGTCAMDACEDGAWVNYEDAMDNYRSVACAEMVCGVTRVTHWTPLPDAPQSAHTEQRNEP